MKKRLQIRLVLFMLLSNGFCVAGLRTWYTKPPHYLLSSLGYGLAALGLSVAIWYTVGSAYFAGAKDALQNRMFQQVKDIPFFQQFLNDEKAE